MNQSILIIMKVGYTALPPQIPDNSEENEEFLKAVHHAILNVTNSRYY